MKSETLSVDNLSMNLYTEQILSNITFKLYDEEILGIVGINGAGKTMLAQMLAGLIIPDSGKISVDGAELNLNSPIASIRCRIGYIDENLQLIRNMTVAENLVIGIDANPRLYYSRRTLFTYAQRILERYHCTVDPRLTVQSLTHFQIMQVQIARQLANRPRVLVFDDPANTFTRKEFKYLETVFRQATSQGTAIVYITHNYDGVMRVANRILVLRQAVIVAELTHNGYGYDGDVIDRIMYGNELKATSKERSAVRNEATRQKREILRVSKLCADEMKAVSFSLNEGEILAIGGLDSSGKSTLAKCLGGHHRIESGKVYFDGIPKRIRSPHDAIRNGIGFYSKKRDEMLLNNNDPIYMSISMGILNRIAAVGIMRKRYEELLAKEYCMQFGIDIDVRCKLGTLNNSTLSKIALACCLATNPRILILDEPNRELDNNGVLTLCSILQKLRKTCAILVIISKIDAIAEICSRSLIMNEGMIIGELEEGELSNDAILHLIKSKGVYKRD